MMLVLALQAIDRGPCASFPTSFRPPSRTVDVFTESISLALEQAFVQLRRIAYDKKSKDCLGARCDGNRRTVYPIPLML